MPGGRVSRAQAVRSGGLIVGKEMGGPMGLVPSCAQPLTELWTVLA